MGRYSLERREWAVRQMMPPQNRTIAELEEETGITAATLYAWRNKARALGVAVPGDGKNAADWSSEEKFRVVLESASLGEAELGEYCRRKDAALAEAAALLVLRKKLAALRGEVEEE